mmetsp:Transcript_31038/g.60918  ORF Transcript_31038/g.60918 Transcript_31038/m.60918 type:complete len:103 (+) Transcript_31038:117-425(+)
MVSGANQDDVLVRCVAVICFAALTLEFLCGVGIVRRRECCAEKDGGYQWCSVLQDVRSLSTFTVGSLLCRHFEAGNRPPGPGPNSNDAAETDSISFSICLLW